MSTIDRFKRSVTEADMERAIRDLVATRHGRVWHCRDSRQAPELEDMPDLIILLPDGLAAIAELKSARRRITLGQQQVAELMSSVTDVFCGIVRPDPRDGETDYDDFLGLLKGER